MDEVDSIESSVVVWCGVSWRCCIRLVWGLAVGSYFWLVRTDFLRMGFPFWKTLRRGTNLDCVVVAWERGTVEVGL